jgi:hypothetical protein
MAPQPVKYEGQQPCMFLNILEAFHDSVKTVTLDTVDMDKVQIYVHQNLPEFNDERMK